MLFIICLCCFIKTCRISTPCLRTTLCQFCSIMLHFLLALLLLHIAYNKCNISITPSLEFTSLFIAHNTFMSIQQCSHTTSSQAYGPFHNCSETIILNQCHHRFIGPRIQHSFIGLETQQGFIGPMTQHSFIGLETQQGFIGPMTQHSCVGPKAQQFFFSPITQQFFFGPVTQISGNMMTFVKYQFCLMTLLHTFRWSLSHFKDQHIQFSKKRVISLDWNINHNIYIFMLNSYDINLLIACILMKLQRYITRRHDFAYYWRSLPFHELLKSQHMFFWVLIVALFQPMSIFYINLFINWIIFLYLLFIRSLIYLYMKIRNLFVHLWRMCVTISRNKINTILHISLLLVHFCEWAHLMTFYKPETSVFTASKVEIKHTFVGGGASTRSDFKMLEPYIISTNCQNPENFNYLYNGHGSFNKVMQKIQTCGENHIICNIPLGSIANILTMTQANEVAKEHNLHILSRKPLAEKQAAIKSHVCTKVCNERITIFKAVDKTKRPKSTKVKKT